MNGIDHNCPWCNKKDICPNEYCSEFCRRAFIDNKGWLDKLANGLDQLLYTGAPAHIEFNKLFGPSEVVGPDSVDEVI